MTKPDDTIFALPHVRRTSPTFRAHYEAIKGLRS